MYVEFPRQDGVLKVSQATKDRVLAYLKCNQELAANPSSLDCFDELNARMSTKEFRTSAQILSGLTVKDANNLRSRITKFVDEGLIERQGCDRKYSYRLVEKLERYGKRSVLRNLNAQETDKKRGS